jgi:hypothetical protein
LEMDKTAALYPYYDKDCVEGQREYKTIRRVDDMPKQVGPFQRYFHEAYPRFKGGKIWTAIYLGTTKTLKDLIKEGLWWFEQFGYQLWDRQLQCESIVTIGWAIGSLPHMNELPIRNALKRELGIEVGLRWRGIDTQEPDAFAVEKKVSAWHFEVSTKDRAKAEDLLAQTYNSRATSFPGYLRLRYAPLHQTVLPTALRIKINRMVVRQHFIVKKLHTQVATEIHTLDFTATTTPMPSLRQRFLAITTKSDNTRQLFHSVDKLERPRHRKGQVVFSIHPDNYAEALTRIASLLSYVWYEIDQTFTFDTLGIRQAFLDRNVNHCFTEYAVEKALRSIWDPITGTVRNAESDYVDELEDCDDDMAQLIDIDMSAMEDATTVSTMMGYIPNLKSTDTVSTIASAFKLARNVKSGTSVGTNDQSQVSGATAKSAISRQSIATAASGITGDDSEATQNTSNTTATTASTKKRMTSINTDLAGLLQSMSTGAITDMDQIRKQIESVQAKAQTGKTEARSAGTLS